MEMHVDNVQGGKPADEKSVAPAEKSGKPLSDTPQSDVSQSDPYSSIRLPNYKKFEADQSGNDASNEESPSDQNQSSVGMVGYWEMFCKKVDNFLERFNEGVENMLNRLYNFYRDIAYAEYRDKHEYKG